MDVIMKLTAVGYLGDRLQQLGQEIQGLGYTLSTMHNSLRSPIPGVQTAIEFHHLAGTAARLQAQIGHTLETAKRLMFEAESVAPKDASNR